MLNISEALKKRCDTHPATRMNNIHFRGLSMIELSAAALAEAHRSGVRLRSLPVEPGQALNVLRIGTRASALARWQADRVREQLAEAGALAAEGWFIGRAQRGE